MLFHFGTMHAKEGGNTLSEYIMEAKHVRNKILLVPTSLLEISWYNKLLNKIF